jgi:hypothetical protein
MEVKRVLQWMQVRVKVSVRGRVKVSVRGSEVGSRLALGLGVNPVRCECQWESKESSSGCRLGLSLGLSLGFRVRVRASVFTLYGVSAYGSQKSHQVDTG